MSRSYRKHPILKDNSKGSKLQKRLYNRRFRRHGHIDSIEMHNNKSNLHRKFNDSYNIHDSMFRWTKEQAENEWECEERLINAGRTDIRLFDYWHKMFGTKEKFMGYWIKCMKRK